MVIAASGGGLSPEEQELLDSEDQLRTDGRFSDDAIAAALAFQAVKNRYMKTKEGWDEYAASRRNALGKAWFAYPGTDLSGPERPNDRTWTSYALIYFYNPSAAPRALRCPFLALFGALDTRAMWIDALRCCRA